MSKPELKRGDIFVTLNPSLLASIIRTGQKVWSDDPKVEFGHAGLIVDPDKGTTLEALWTVRYGSLKKYENKFTLIGRCKTKIDGSEVIQSDIDIALDMLIEDQLGRHYPIHRLLLHALGPTGKWGSGSFLVCSELAGKEAWFVNSINWYKGMNPDELGEVIRRHREFEVIHDGLLEWDH